MMPNSDRERLSGLEPSRSAQIEVDVTPLALFIPN